MIDLPAVLADVGRGLVPAHIYNDQEIFEFGRDRLFSQAWVFVAYESEIPSPGDYVVRRVLADSFIVARDESGTVRVMFNMCLHKGSATGLGCGSSRQAQARRSCCARSSSRR